MQASTVSDPKPFRSTLVVAVTVLLAFLGIAGLKSYQGLDSARLRQAQLEERIQGTEEEIQRLQRRVRLLEDDPVLLERLAREDLWLAKPGDLVVVLPAHLDQPNVAERGAEPAGSIH